MYVPPSLVRHPLYNFRVLTQIYIPHVSNALKVSILETPSRSVLMHPLGRYIFRVHREIYISNVENVPNVLRLNRSYPLVFMLPYVHYILIVVT